MCSSRTVLRTGIGVALSFLIIGTAVVLAQTRETGFLDRALSLGSETYRYQVYVPRGYSGDHAWPIILYLHACCIQSVDGMPPTNEGPGTAIRNNRDRFPGIVVFPHTMPDHRWDNAMLARAVATLDAASREFRVDPDRQYLMGFSMGGRGAWSLAAQQPDRFAAAVIIAAPVAHIPEFWTPIQRETVLRDNDFLRSDNPFGVLASKLTTMPIWLFQGSADDLAPPDDARRMWSALQRVNPSAKFTEYDGGGHDQTRTMADPELWKWLLNQRRNPNGR